MFSPRTPLRAPASHSARCPHPCTGASPRPQESEGSRVFGGHGPPRLTSHRPSVASGSALPADMSAPRPSWVSEVLWALCPCPPRCPPHSGLPCALQAPGPLLGGRAPAVSSWASADLLLADPRELPGPSRSADLTQWKHTGVERSVCSGGGGVLQNGPSLAQVLELFSGHGTGFPERSQCSDRCLEGFPGNGEERWKPAPREAQTKAALQGDTNQRSVRPPGLLVANCPRLAPCKETATRQGPDRPRSRPRSRLSVSVFHTSVGTSFPWNPTRTCGSVRWPPRRVTGLLCHGAGGAVRELVTRRGGRELGA